jgi:hypothetical protein
MKFSKRRLHVALASLAFLIAVFSLTGFVFRKTGQEQLKGLEIELPAVPTDSTVPVVGSLTGFFIFFGSPIGISLATVIIALMLVFFYKKK